MQKFGSHNGYRVDKKNYSWLYLSDFICLSYSFMTFVQIEQEYETRREYRKEDYYFDLETYNYIIKGRTVFHDERVINNYERLSYILKNLAKINPQYLEQIQFYYFESRAEGGKSSMMMTESLHSQGSVEGDNHELVPSYPFGTDANFSERLYKITPLHIAHHMKNNRAVKILLQTMAKIPYNASETFKDILPDLIDYNGFLDYIHELPFQTQQMINKQTLRQSNPFGDSIVAINYSRSSYIDDIYFNKSMGEDSENQSQKIYPVKVMALTMKWVLKDDSEDGKRFLLQILRSENLDLYYVPTIVILIEFLYAKYKQVVIRRHLWVYLSQLLIYILMLVFDESKWEVVRGEKLTLQKKLDHNTVLITVFAILNIVINIYQALLTFQKFYSNRDHWLDTWVIVDIVTLSMSITVAFLVLAQDGKVPEFNGQRIMA